MIERVHAQLNNADASAPDFPSVVLLGHGSSGVPSVSRRCVAWGRTGTSGTPIATEETSPQLRWWVRPTRHALLRERPAGRRRSVGLLISVEPGVV